MQNSFHTLYITHRQAEVSIRERFSLSEKETESLLLDIKNIDGVEEAFVLSTCNRTEIYWYGREEGTTHQLKKKFAALKELSFREIMEAPFENIHQENKVIERFFEVAVGVHSQIVGDWQITHQVKQAYQTATEVGTIGTYFHRLIARVLQASKEVTSQTGFRSGAASVSFATADLVRQLVKKDENLHILVVGVGKIGADTVRHLHKMGIQNVSISNRTYGKSAMLATENAYQVVAFEDVFEEAQKADVVISSVSMPNFFSQDELQTDLLQQNQYFIDLSMPRSIESSLDNFVKIRNIDDLKEQTKAVREARAAALPIVKRILNESISDYLKWKDEHKVISALHPFKEALEDLKNNLYKQYGSKADEKSKELMAQMLNDFSNKALRMSIVKIKNKLNQDNQKPILSAVEHLFG